MGGVLHVVMFAHDTSGIAYRDRSNEDNIMRSDQGNEILLLSCCERQRHHTGRRAHDCICSVGLSASLSLQASKYLADQTLESIGEMFVSARAIMGWLADCARVVASADAPVRWSSPLGLPIMQPYHKLPTQSVATSTQSFSVSTGACVCRTRRGGVTCGHLWARLARLW
jgi:hypothetical protein